ncbi:MAG: FMN-binding protein [Psychroflexus maritimus]
MKSTYFLYTFLASCVTFFSIQLSLEKSPSKKLEAKMKKAIEQVVEVNNFKLIPLETSILSSAETSWEASQTYIYQIRIDDEVQAFAYLSQANSMKDVFDYLIIVDTELKILKSKVLIYREQHGQQIGSQRWLKQFIGMTSESQLELGKDIQAISGATISAQSMTKATQKALEQMNFLKSKKVLNND